MKLLNKIIIIALFGVILVHDAASAQQNGSASQWVETDHSSVRLVSSINAVGQGDRVLFGLHFKLRKGWKIYWRSPGDAGYPPSLEWSGATNLQKAELRWPLPTRFSVLGFETLGYKDEVIIPIEVIPETVGTPLRLNARVDYLTCNDICVPYEANLAINLPAGEATPSDHAHLINRFHVKVPGDGASHGLSIDKVELVGAGKEAILRISASALPPFQTPDVFIEASDILAFAKPSAQFSDNNRKVTLKAKVYGLEDLDPPDTLTGANVTLTLADGDRSAERTLPVMTGTNVASSNAPVTTLSLPLILALAVLGGLILNLMPCVLPVLSIKLLGVVSHGGRDKRDVRLSFIASAAGIITTFLGLAAALVILKTAGMSIGWGIQFQHPWFLIIMTIIVTLFACNLWGFYEVHLPEWVDDLGGHIGQHQKPEEHGLGGHFLTGAFATLLATPCSAPFLGTAVGFALARNASDIFAVFAALGIGLALPYLLIAMAPGLAVMLPRPGRWMLVLRRIMGFALAATALWLLSVISVQIGFYGALIIGALMAIMMIAIYYARNRNSLWKIGGSAAVALSVLALLVPSFLDKTAFETGAPAKSAELDGIWHPFDLQSIDKHVAEGRTVFVDVTADWCITCQLNKTVVLSRGNVLERLKEENVVSMQADWTLPDDGIAQYLASFQRYGIPFNAVYGPVHPEGIPLPELLTEKIVLEALDQATPSTISTQ